MKMWEIYSAALRKAEEEWWEGDTPPVITAIARATGLDPKELHDRIEGQLGWETHDAGYEYTAWFTAWSMKGYPDWQGTEPVPLTAEEAADERWRQETAPEGM